MIKKLRRRLIAISMLSIFIVLLLIIGTLNILNLNSLITKADSTLNILCENDGYFPKDNRDNMQKKDDKEPKDLNEPRLFDSNSPEKEYKTRYFFVLFDSEGNILQTDTSKIAALNTKQANTLASEIYNKNSTSGFTSYYRYMKDYQENDNIMVIILDCSVELEDFFITLIFSVSASLLGMLLVFILVLILSVKIVKPISDSYEKQKRFITDAGHELKTPLAIIEADVSVLEMDIENNEWIEDIRNQKNRLLDLTNDLIFLSKLEEDNKIVATEFSISDMLVECISDFSTLIKANNKIINSSIENNISYSGDEKSIRKLINVLIDNSIKYSEDENINISLKKEKHKIVFSISNKAGNLSQEDVNNIFERFYRGDKSRSTNIKGYGIGMSIANAVTLQHKGKISAKLSGDILKIKVVL